VNHKRVRRLYREEGLNLRVKRPRRHVSAAHRTERAPATAPNRIWAMHFVSDALFDGRRLRAPTLLDMFTRVALAIEADKGITGEQVAGILDAVLATRPAPQRIRVDNGPEFVSNALDRWAYEHGVTFDFSRPGRPIDNAFAESFNGRFREEYLNAHWILSLDDAWAKIEAWRRFYNESRPHSALGDRTPHKFA
jgi:putative transposase